MKRLFALWLLLLGFVAGAAEVIPPAPPRYFNDYANVVSAATAGQLNSRLEQFERDASSQVIVAIFPKMQSDSSIEDYTVRVAQSWKVGQKKQDNGAVLFVFIQDRKMFLQVGYGLEGVLPDATCKRIIEDEIKPYFKSGNFNGGLTAGVNAILAAAKGEYKGSGRTVHESRGSSDLGRKQTLFNIALIIVVICVILVMKSSRSNYSYSRRGRSFYGGTWGGGGWSGGGGSSGGGGGGFSGGGGSFGGGGAGGSW